MAATLTSERATAAKAVVARLREVKRAEVVPSWARQSLPTVIALESDELRDVMVRCTHHDRSVLVGVYYPETGEVEAVEFTPQAVPAKPTEGSTRLGDGVTVGMLLSMIRPDRWERLLERAAPSAVA